MYDIITQKIYINEVFKIKQLFLFKIILFFYSSIKVRLQMSFSNCG